MNTNCVDSEGAKEAHYQSVRGSKWFGGTLMEWREKMRSVIGDISQSRARSRTDLAKKLPLIWISQNLVCHCKNVISDDLYLSWLIMQPGSDKEICQETWSKWKLWRWTVKLCDIDQNLSHQRESKVRFPAICRLIPRRCSQYCINYANDAPLSISIVVLEPLIAVNKIIERKGRWGRECQRDVRMRSERSAVAGLICRTLCPQEGGCLVDSMVSGAEPC